MALRPQLLGMAFFAVLLVIIDRRRTMPRLLWPAPLLVAIWANLHGSFFLGPVVSGWRGSPTSTIDPRGRTRRWPWRW